MEGFDPDGGRDIVFVPVAINYDRVLEDRVLIAAHARGDRRFGARISVVVAFILRKFWRRLRGHDTRFGTAAVAFGAPVSLRAFGKVDDVDELSEVLMARIEAVMPVLGVPLVATALCRNGPLDAGALEAAVSALLNRIPTKSIVLDSADLPAELSRACGHMVQHGLIEQRNGIWHIMEGEETAAQFYANSIAHYLGEGGISDNAADAKVISAPAGS